MEQSILIFSVVLLCNFFTLSQNIINTATTGFDTLRSGIPHGKNYSISYYSKTADTKWRSLIYTPEVFLKDKNYLQLWTFKFIYSINLNCYKL
jgi:hypothetical protein